MSTREAVESYIADYVEYIFVHWHTYPDRKFQNYGNVIYHFQYCTILSI